MRRFRDALRLPIGRIAGAAWIIATAALAALAVTLQHRDRTGTLDTYADLRAYSANAAADTINRIFATMDILFGQAMDDWRASSGSLDQLYDSLAASGERIGRTMLALENVTIIDSDGRVRFSANPATIGFHLGDREYFTVHRDGTRRGMWIGEPIMSRITPGRRLLPVSWSIVDADGRFLGILWASVSPEVLSQVLVNYRDTQDSFVGLVSSAGATLATDRQERLIEIPAQAIRGVRPDRTSTIVPDMRIDGLHGTWHVTGRAVGNTGMIVVLGSTEEQMLSTWYVRTTTVAALILLVTLFLGAFTIAILRLAGDENRARRQAEEAARKATLADLSKTEFLAVISHEIRTPLTAIIGMAELLASANLRAAEHRRVQAIRAGGRQMLTIVNDVLDFTRLGAGGIELERIAFSLPALVEEVRSTMEPAAQERGLGMTVEIERAPAHWFFGDPNRLRQILLNLVGNAVKFTERGSVRISIERDPSRAQADPFAPRWLRFEVTDTGIGIPPEQRERLFQPFAQGDSSMARRYGGSGLGLAICKRLVEAMGGSIGMTSAPGSGSRFHFTIPLEPAPAPIPDGERPAAPPRPPSRCRCWSPRMSRSTGNWYAPS
ncbi:hypothetical protein STAQ_28960 [Allostella sp. ATCC 35155]|nr:hypothetical protein STAQ_28960 [Stella sp. ATCC 35155]